MATITLRGKDKLYTHFKNVNDPYWKLYNASDSKTPIQTCLSVKQVSESLKYLVDIVDSIDPDGIYILDTFSVAENKGEQRFLKPNTSLCFSINEAVQERIVDNKKDAVSYHQPASMKEHLDLIRDNAKLTVEVTMYKQYWEDAQKKISELENEIEELEDIIEEYEEEEEEEGVAGTQAPAKNMEEALSRLVTEHGGTIIENFMSPSTKEKVDFSNEEEQKGEVKVNGVINNIPQINDIIEELNERDPQLQKHLYKLLIIAREKPITFKMFLKKLEDF